ncbi:HEAT repeat domain-containing protein [Angustibacter luteus]|uniref:HEAT repeat domain-containing protein n=1 Tax=Angustibacter luteus TaxID=658456 RepID=A0ABW1JAJ5_9ACTN
MRWANEAELLAALSTWEPLPDEDDPRWDDDEVWRDAERLIQAADAAGDAGWREAAVRVFEHAADWDLNGMMPHIRHGPERAYPEDSGSQEFAHRLEQLAGHVRAGTRLWIVRELGLLRQLSSLPVILERLTDPHPRVADTAVDSLHMLAQVYAEAVTELWSRELGA